MSLSKYHGEHHEMHAEDSQVSRWSYKDDCKVQGEKSVHAVV